MNELLSRMVPGLFVRGPDELEIFDGDSEMFKRVVSAARVYGEYGVGASTEWVYTNTNARIVAVETSPVWANTVLRGKDQARISITIPDLGEIHEWGRPASYRLRKNFPTYCQHMWDSFTKPDTVLIDGRFRVACFIASLLNAAPGCRIIVDDYCDRPHYHLVEEVVKPLETCGRQALFEVPERFDRHLAEQIGADFRMVMD